MKSPILGKNVCGGWLLSLMLLVRSCQKIFEKSFVRLEKFANLKCGLASISGLGILSFRALPITASCDSPPRFLLLNFICCHGRPLLQCKRRVRIAFYTLYYETSVLIFCSYIEGVVRGYRNSLLTGQNYNNLVQCETIDGICLPHP